MHYFSLNRSYNVHSFFLCGMATCTQLNNRFCEEVRTVTGMGVMTQAASVWYRGDHMDISLRERSFFVTAITEFGRIINEDIVEIRSVRSVTACT